jgi:DNA-binding phage protein
LSDSEYCYLRDFTALNMAGDTMMALTKDFKDTMQARAHRDPAFRKALLQEGVECMLAGNVDTGKAVLRDYINATIRFEELSQVFDKSSKSLMRMFGPKGNPQASNLFAVIQYLQEQEDIHLEVKARKVA